MQAIDLVAVSYLNTKPFLEGLYTYFPQDAPTQGYQLNISLDTPARCAQKLEQGKAQIGLIPTAQIPFVNNATIISDFCIGATERVKTVCLYSKQPLERIKTIHLDYQSRTSAQLLQLLARYHWRINPQFMPAPAHFEQELDNLDAFLIIGDRTIGLEARFEYVYDLAEHWVDFSGLPFVFAAWVSTGELSDNFLTYFNQSLAYGCSQRELVADKWKHLYPDFDLKHYYQKAISYELDAAKKAGLKLFLELSANFQPQKNLF